MSIDITGICKSFTRAQVGMFWSNTSDKKREDLLENKLFLEIMRSIWMPRNLKVFLIFPEFVALNQTSRSGDTFVSLTVCLCTNICFLKQNRKLKNTQFQRGRSVTAEVLHQSSARAWLFCYRRKLSNQRTEAGLNWALHFQMDPLSCYCSSDPNIWNVSLLYLCTNDHLWSGTGAAPLCSSVSPPSASTCLVCFQRSSSPFAPS